MLISLHQLAVVIADSTASGLEKRNTHKNTGDPHKWMDVGHLATERHRKTWNINTRSQVHSQTNKDWKPARGQRQTFGLKLCLSHSWVGSTYSYSCQKSLGHVGNDDTDEEDDGFQPGVSENQRQDEESHAKEDGHACDDVNKVLNLLSYGRLKKRNNSVHDHKHNYFNILSFVSTTPAHFLHFWGEFQDLKITSTDIWQTLIRN